MTGAMYSAISGMKAHMNKLNVIGNNVANVNTPGYKSGRATFQESLYTSVRSGSNGSNTSGGMNPAQLGYGANIGTIDLDMSTKNYVPTGDKLHCMINGDGFFLVGQKPAETAIDTSTANLAPTDAKNLDLTRVGNFGFDSQGYLVDGNGAVVYGFVTCAGTTITAPATEPAKATAPGAAHPDKPAVSTQLVPIRLPMASATTGKAVFPGVDSDGKNVYPTGLKPIEKNLESITIDGKTGRITAYSPQDNATIVVGYVALAQVANPNGVTHTQGPYYIAGEGAGDCTAASIGDVLKGNCLDNKVVDAQGKIPAGAVAIFGTGGTSLIPNGLESSGTDIATEFSEMISTQRGYQANTRIITVTDSMLEELVNIKR